MIPLDEVVFDNLLLAPGALVAVDPDVLVSTIGHLENDVISNIPIRELTYVFGRPTHLFFPRRHQASYTIFIKQGLTFGKILVAFGEIRLKFARQRRVNEFLFDVVKKRVERIVILLRNRIVLMIVTLRAADREAEPDRTHGVGAINGLFKESLVQFDATLTVAQRIAVEAGGDAILGGGVGQQVSRKLQGGEAVKRHVGIERVDDPLPPPPSPRAGEIFFIAVRVRIAGQIKPLASPALSVVRRLKKTIDDPLIGVRRLVRQERIHFGWCGREAGEVKRDTAEQGRLGGGRRGLDVRSFEACEDEGVDRIAGAGGLRNRRARQRGKGPGLGSRTTRSERRLGDGRLRPGGSGVNPGAEGRYFVRGQRGTGGRHAEAVLAAGDALD